jgi:hypothetical protein
MELWTVQKRPPLKSKGTSQDGKGPLPEHSPCARLDDRDFRSGHGRWRSVVQLPFGFATSEDDGRHVER